MSIYTIIADGEFPVLASDGGEFGVIQGRVVRSPKIDWYGSASWFPREAEAIELSRKMQAARNAEISKIMAMESAADGREIFEVVVFGGEGHDELRGRVARYRTLAAAQLDRAFREIDSAAPYSPAIAIFRYHHGWKTFVSAMSSTGIAVRRNARAALPAIDRRES